MKKLVNGKPVEMTPQEVADLLASQTPSAEEQLAEAKSARFDLVRQIIVTTESGKQFNGDEDSQNRMSRAINGMVESDTTLWVLADNQPAMVSQAELKEALRKAGIAQTQIWVAPYQ